MGDYQDTDKLLRMFRSVECGCCQRHFAFQDRLRRELLFCSSACVGHEMNSRVQESNHVDGAPTETKKVLISTEASHGRSEMERHRAPDSNDVVDTSQVMARGRMPPAAAVTGTKASATNKVEVNHVRAEKPLLIPSQVLAHQEKLVRGGQPNKPESVETIRAIPKEPVKATSDEKMKRANPFIQRYMEDEPSEVKPKSDVKPVVKVPDSVPTVEFGINQLVAALSDELQWSELTIGLQSVLERCHADSPLDFYVQTTQGSNEATILAQAISDMLAKKENQVRLRNFKIGTLCLAPFEDIYYRGEIVEVTGSPPLYTIHFSDYGNTADCKPDELIEMPDEFKKAPRYAINCQWDMAIAKELVKDQQDLIFEATGTQITPKVKITDGQYLVSIGAYTPKKKLVRKSE